MQCSIRFTSLNKILGILPVFLLLWCISLEQNLIKLAMVLRNLRQTCFQAGVVVIILCAPVLFYSFIKFYSNKSPSWLALLSSTSLDLPFTELDEAKDKTGSDFWNSLQPSFDCPRNALLRLGSKAGNGKWTCGAENLGRLSLRNGAFSCVVYSFGSRRDSSFEAELLSITSCQLFAYNQAKEEISPPLRSTNPRVRFEKLSISGRDFRNFRTLKSFMNKNGGHDWIDILKMDSGIATFESLDNILHSFSLLPFGQLLIEFNLGSDGTKNQTKIANRILHFVGQLEKKGLRLFSTEINHSDKNICQLSFININTLELFLTSSEVDEMLGI